jgi:hypothetical protein
LSSIVFNLYDKYLTSEAPEGFGEFKIRGQVIGTAKYADDLVLLVEEEPVLQGMVERMMNLIDAMEWKLMWIKLRC